MRGYETGAGRWTECRIDTAELIPGRWAGDPSGGRWTFTRADGSVGGLGEPTVWRRTEEGGIVIVDQPPARVGFAMRVPCRQRMGLTTSVSKRDGSSTDPAFTR